MIRLAELPVTFANIGGAMKARGIRGRESVTYECFPNRRANAIIKFDGRTRTTPFAATLLSSSMAEHPAVNRRVVGSSPT